MKLKEKWMILVMKVDMFQVIYVIQHMINGVLIITILIGNLKRKFLIEKCLYLA